jgi:WD40 repeat protein
LIVSSRDGWVRGWKGNNSNGYVVAGQPFKKDEPLEHKFPAAVYCMDFNASSDSLFCGLKSGSILVWSLKMDSKKALPSGHTALVSCLLVLPRMQMLASADISGTLLLWDISTKSLKWHYKGHSKAIVSLCFSTALNLLFSAGYDQSICIWNPYTPDLIHMMGGP